MQVVYVKIHDIIPYENNPRRNTDAVKYVRKSIEQFGFKVPMVLDAQNIIVCGHTRYLAAQEIGMEEVPCVYADDLSEEQIRAFRLADNKTAEAAGWDFDALEIELQDITGIDMSDFGFDLDIAADTKESVDHTKLTDKFGVPPFSVLDTRQGYWQERKKQWRGYGIQSEKGRKNNLTYAIDLPSYLDNGTKGIAVQTSIFDPVLAEIMYKWFCPEGGTIYDCFAGGSVRGCVADKLGYKYIGIDLRQEQVDANYQNSAMLGLSPVWHCDDSLNADKYIEDDSADMIFSCPPYFDLEVYSDDPHDISNMSYEDFCVTYRKIIDISCRKLKKDRFAVFVVGDIRDKKGYYRNFVDFTKECFCENGLHSYNDLVIIEQVGTAAVRAKKQMISGRKVVKTHQNVLCFFKGDCKNIKSTYGDIDLEYDDFEQFAE